MFLWSGKRLCKYTTRSCASRLACCGSLVVCRCAWIGLTHQRPSSAPPAWGWRTCLWEALSACGPPHNAACPRCSARLCTLRGRPRRSPSRRPPRCPLWCAAMQGRSERRVEFKRRQTYVTHLWNTTREVCFSQKLRSKRERKQTKGVSTDWLRYLKRSLLCYSRLSLFSCFSAS